MDWRILELITALLVAIVIVLGPFIKGREELRRKRSSGRTQAQAKSFIVLMDFAYYLVFGAYILFTPVLTRRLEPVVTGVQLAELIKVAGILLLMGVLHGVSLLLQSSDAC